MSGGVRLQPGAWRFWLATLGAAAGIAVTASLGNWQLGRAAQKNALHDAVVRQGALPPLDNAALASAAQPAALVSRQIVLRGTWEAGSQVFLDNRQMNGKPGFFVVAPLRLAESGKAVLVQRGWVQRNFTDRAQLPPVQPPPGIVEVRGRVVPPPSHLFELAAPGEGKGTSPIRQNLDLAAFAAETKLPLMADVSVLQTGPAGEGLLREWHEPSSGVAKHYGYAFQWFGLAVLIAILYAWFQLIVPRRQARTAR